MSDLTPPGPGGDRAEPLSRAVVDAIADHEGVDPTNLEPCLYDVIDPEALDALFPDGSPSGAGGRVRFSYDGRDVCVSADGRVRVSDPDD